jgi:hypothetical protein
MIGLYHHNGGAIKGIMASQVAIKPLLLAYLKAKDAQSLHDALDDIQPTRRQVRYFVSELRGANRDISAIESWCLKHGYTGSETSTGKRERPKRGMSKLYRTQYLRSTNEWYIRLPITPLLDDLGEEDRKTNVVVVWQEDRVVVTLPEGFMRALRATVVEAEKPLESLPPKRRSAQTRSPSRTSKS